MNKRKTLRMTSILLALMMFFGMVSVLLVPAGTAGAADTSVEIIIPDTGDDGTTTYDTNNIVIVPQSATDPRSFTLKVVDYDTDLTAYEGLYLELIGPDGAIVPGYSLSNKVKMTKVDNYTYTYDMTITHEQSAFFNTTNGYKTGLYKIKTYAYIGANNLTGETHTLAAFWFASLTRYNGAITNTIADPRYTFTAPDKHYVGPEAELNVTLDISTPWGSMTDPELRIINPFDGSEVYRANSVTAIAQKIVVPKTVIHGKKYALGALARYDIVDDPNSLYKTEFFPFNQAGLGSTGSIPYTVTVDAKAPVIKASDITMTFGILNTGGTPTYYTKPKTLADIKDGTKYFAVAPVIGGGTDTSAQIRFQMASKNSVTDADSGVIIETTVTADLYKGISAWLYEPGQGAAKEMEVNRPGAIISKYTESSVLNTTYTATASTPAGYVSWQAGGRYKFIFRATDAVGNTAEVSTGYVDIDAKYNPINKVDAVINEYTLAVGDEILYEDLQNWTKAVVYGVDRTKPATDEDAWTLVDTTLAGANPLRDYFDIVYDDDNEKIVKLIAKKAGQTTITLKAADVYYELNAAFTNHVYKDNSYEAAINPVANNNFLYFTITEPSANPATSVTVSPKTKELSVGEKFIPTATVGPTTAYDRTVNWVSSKPAVATVDATTGEVTAVADGEAWIYARSNMNSGVQDSCLVTVGKTVDPDPVPEPKPDDGWKDEGNNRYYYIDGQKVVGWRKIDGSWYFFDYTSAAMRANGWLKEGGKWYYLNSNGTMKSAEWFKDNNGKWYWLKANGAMAAGWEKINGTWYYFNASGAMQTGWVNVRGIWYYMKSSGAMAEGWLQDGGSWYYLTPGGGAMVTGRVTINGRASNFATSGRWLGYV